MVLPTRTSDNLLRYNCYSTVLIQVAHRTENALQGGSVMAKSGRRYSADNTEARFALSFLRESRSC